MEKENSENNINSALKKKWDRFSESEVKEVVQDHNKLINLLNYRYSMSKNEAKNEAKTFFKPFETKIASGQVK